MAGASPDATAQAEADIFSTIIGAGLAGRAQSKAQKRAIAAEQAMFERQVALQEPWRQAGMGALSDLRSLLSNPQSIEESPAYQFRVGEGQKALERNLSARGNMLSGSALKELTRYGQGMASDEYQNQFNRLASLAGIGQAATNTMTGATGAFGSRLGAAEESLGNIKASSYLGAAGGISNAIGNYMNYNLLRDIYGNDGESSYQGGMKSPRAWDGTYD